MKISIITVCYNAAETIEKALLSIQSQTYADIEKVIIDGGSSDGTQDIVKKYLSPGDKFISQKDKGIYDAMNKGIIVATGDVVYFLNADDSFIDPNVVDQMAAIFTQDPQKAVIYGRVSHENMPAGYKGKQPRQIYSANAFITQTICHQAVFVRRALFDAVGKFDIRYRYVADQEWLLRAFKRYDRHFFYWDRMVAFYHYQGQSFQNRKIVRKEKQDVLRRHFPPGVFLFYWFRYIFIRGLKKKVLKEPW